jgi:UDP-N-acetylmuramyl pentapeptide phosphotransferase/UDP-N-acetylglucosamine-1-phosphate transferase
MLLFLVGSSFLFALIGTRWLAIPGNKLCSADLPNCRSLHEKATPRGGGLSIVVALVLLQLILSAQGEGLFPSPVALAGFIAIALVSFWDDRLSLPSWFRFLIHAGAATFLFWDELRWDVLPLPGLVDAPLSLGWLALPATVLFSVWFTNLFNFMDGMDGLSGGMTVFGFGGCSWMAYLGNDPQLGALCAVTASAATGFLVWNFPPARIFMGDVAAAPLGFLVAVVSFRGTSSGAFEVWVPLILFAPFWIDATVTLIRRAVNRERFWEPHRSHAYQRLAQSGWGHRRTTLFEYGVMISMLVAARLYVELTSAQQFLLLAGIAGFFAGLWALVHSVEGRAKI